MAKVDGEPEGSELARRARNGRGDSKGFPTHSDIEAIRSRLRTDGFAVIPAQATAAELAVLRSETLALVDKFANGYRADDFWCYEHPRTGTDMLYRVHNLEKQQDAPACSALFRGGLLHDLAGAILGSAAATVCAMIVKSPGVAGVPWHRDRINAAPGDALNLSLFLDPATIPNGCIEAVPCTHLLPDGIEVLEVRDTGPREPILVAPGDVTVHDVRLVHGSGDNTTTGLRRSVIVEFTRGG